VYSGCVFPAASRLRRCGRRPTATDKDGSLGTVTAAELGKDVAHVRVDGALGDEQPFGDLPVRQAPGDQLCDLVFALGEREFLLRTRRSRLWGEPQCGGDAVAAADYPARFVWSCRGSKFCCRLCRYVANHCLHGREGATANTLAQAVGDT
jgi:hypothetical protein